MKERTVWSQEGEKIQYREKERCPKSRWGNISGKTCLVDK